MNVHVAVEVTNRFRGVRFIVLQGPFAMEESDLNSEEGISVALGHTTTAIDQVEKIIKKANMQGFTVSHARVITFEEMEHE